MVIFRARMGDLHAAIGRYAGGAQRNLSYAWLRGMRGLVKRAMGITPPAYGNTSFGGGARGEGGGLTKADEMRGRSSIGADLGNVFAGVTLKGKRPEQLPDVQAKHRELFRTRKRPGRRLQSDLGAGRYYYVDERKLRSLRRDLEKRVGRLASGWLAGAEALKVTGTPAWVKRHGTSRGTSRLVMGFLRYRLTVANTHVHADLVGVLEHRLNYAATYAANALTRETDVLLKKSGRQAGFTMR
jgi:hypothetical protein